MQSLKQQAISGVKWTGASTIFIGLIEFIKFAVLARLLSPSDFGLMGMLVVIMGFAQAFADMGVSNAIIHKQNTTEEQLSSLYWLNIFIGALLFLILCVANPLIVRFYKEPRLGHLIFWVALIFPITSLGQQFQILLQKKLKFSKLSRIEVISVILGSITAILLAVKGQGVLSLIWGQIATATIKSLLLIRFSGKKFPPAFRFEKKDLRDYLSFGLYQMGERNVNYLSSNIDYLLIGRFLGADALGIYTLAYKLITVPLMKITPILTRVAFPVFSKKQTDNASINRGYLAIIKILSFIVFPSLIGLSVTAPIFVPVIYGTNWARTVPVIQILAIVGMIKATGSLSGSVLLAKGRADITFIWNFIVCITNFFVFWIAARRGLLTVAWSWVGLSIFYFICGRWMLYKVIGLKWKNYLSALMNPALMSLIMGIAVYIVYLVCLSNELNNLVSLIILVTFGIIVYSSLVMLFERSYFLDLLAFLRNKEPRGI